MENLRAVLEGILFIVGDEGVTIEQLCEAIEINDVLIQMELDQIQKKYLDDEYGFELVNYGGIYKFISKAMVHVYVERLFQKIKFHTLSSSATETLAIIAYKHPITRVEIEEIRGVGCDMMLRKLQARNLIQEAGRSDAPGKPILYTVTKEFMDSFKLVSLDELPKLPELGQEEESDNLFD